MFNVVTIAREYGSGGAEVGRRTAEMLGWELVDKQIIERVATVNKIDRAWAESADEQSCAWWERVMQGFRNGGPEVYTGGIADIGVDRDVLQQFTAHVIEKAGRAGHCVIVGRGSQCVLRKHPQAMHVLIYAPLQEKLQRAKQRHPHERDMEGLLRRMDAGRLRYIEDYFSRNSADRNLYHLCLNSTIGLDVCAELIVNAVRLSEVKLLAEKVKMHA